MHIVRFISMVDLELCHGNLPWYVLYNAWGLIGCSVQNPAQRGSTSRSHCNRYDHLIF